MDDAIVLAREEGRAGAAKLEKLVAGLGFAVHHARTADEAGTALAQSGAQVRLLIIADALADDLRAPLYAARQGGAICILVTPGPAASTDADVDAVCTDAELEKTLLELLASRGYLAMPAKESRGIGAAIEDQTMGDAGFADELIRALLSSTEADLAALRAGGEDPEAIRAVAHRLKSSAHFIACHAFRALAQRLETAARDGDRRTVAALLRIFVPATENLYVLLREHLPESPLGLP